MCIGARKEGAISEFDQASLSERAYAAIRGALIEGRFRPCERLVLHKLAAQLNTSITPVREACRRLVYEHALTLRSRRFVTVPPMTEARYLEVRAIRIELEGLATALAAGNARPGDIDELQRIQEAYESAEAQRDAEAAHALNLRFHFTVYELSRKDMLVSMIGNLWVSMGPMLTVYHHDDTKRYVGGGAHREVIGALLQADAEAARLAIRNDILSGGEDILNFLRRRRKAGGDNTV